MDYTTNNAVNLITGTLSPLDTPSNIKEINLDYIIAYVKEQGGEAIEWLKEFANKKITRTVKVKPKKSKKKGKKDEQNDGEQQEETIITKPTFIEIRNAFVERYMPELKPKAKPKEPSMYDIINAL